MWVFESLNCIVCKKPFVPIARQPRSPRLLLCGSAMCHECFEKEKSLKQEEREHKCDYGEKCFYNPNFAYCVIDVLSQDCFTLSPILGGYLLMKPLVNPECPICHDEYSNKDASKEAFFLYCMHIVCTECRQKRSEQNNDIATRATWTYEIACPTCTTTSRVITTSGENRRKNWLQDFLNELPEMTYQLEEMNKSGYRFCDECKKLDIVDEMHHCKKCSLQLCGNCIYKNHRSHKAVTLLQKEADLMSHELCDLSINFLNELPEMTRQLEEMDKTGYRFCEECKGLDVVDRMFRCNGCVLKLCGTCTHRRHRSHETMTLLENEVNQMSEKLRCVSFDEINKSVFPVLHNELINGIHLFEEKFINQVDTLTTVVTYEGLQKDHKECMKLKTDFEACSEEYMRELLKYDAKIKVG
ncbi:unnamed protein product, partial [Mesorhabditis belari]|uniref:RING-type domain-containing protein n=1 Tax=Mesorhabditis belari TaxID=2138241 RepID=A0AAF3EHX6_9BILA